MIERQRHAKDRAHPMYDIIDNALSAAVDVYYKYNVWRWQYYVLR